MKTVMFVSAALAVVVPAQARGALWLVTGAGEGDTSTCVPRPGERCGDRLTLDFFAIVDDQWEWQGDRTRQGIIGSDWVRLESVERPDVATILRQLTVQGAAGTGFRTGVGNFSYIDRGRRDLIQAAGTVSLKVEAYEGVLPRNTFDFRVGFVPEPATWAMMIAGFAMVGAIVRRRPSAAAV